jgi:hypothetical protein
MDEKERRFISFQVSAKEAETIEAAAAQQGVSRSEYLRQKLLAPAVQPTNCDIEAMLRHLIHITNCTHGAVYSIAETAGTVPTPQLREIYDDLTTAMTRYLADLPNRMAKVQERVRQQKLSDPPVQAA